LEPISRAEATVVEYNSLEGWVDVTVVERAAVTSVTLSESELTMYVGDSATLVATVEPDDATNQTVTWLTSSSTKATVSSSGKVTAKAVGVVIITVRTQDGSKTDTCTVTILAVP